MTTASDSTLNNAGEAEYDPLANHPALLPPSARWLFGFDTAVALGGAGMILATLIAGVFLSTTATLVVCIIAIGFSTGFYIVPLFTLLQHRAPKTSKGDFIATSNLINVTGAIVASLVFFLIDFGATRSGLVPQLEQHDRRPG